MEITFETKPVKGQAVSLISLSDYDHIIISESGGKDSMACLFILLDEGVPPEKIELWHQSVDGGFEDTIEFMDCVT